MSSFDSIVAWNIQGVTQLKFDSMTVDMDPLVQVICLSETWCLEESVGQFSLGEFSLGASFCRRNHIRGGVGIWVRRGLQTKPLSLEEYCVEVDFEICGIEWFNYYILSAYRSPSADFARFMFSLETILSRLHSVKNSLILTGDFNVDLLSDPKEKEQLVSLLSTYGLSQVVKEPTRVTVNSSTLIDHVYIKHDNFVSVSNIDNCFSDHRMIKFSIRHHCKHSNSSFVNRRVYNNENVIGFKGRLAAETWATVYAEQGINQQFNAFYEIFLRHFYASFPVKKVFVRTRSWITEEVRQSSNRLKMLFQMYKQSLIDRNRYLLAKNAHCKLVIATKKSFSTIG